MPCARIHVIPMAAPDDMSGLARLVEEGDLQSDRLVAVLGKTEGNGCVNDFTRAFAVSCLQGVLGDAAQGVTLVMSGGTEGGLSPHMVSFEVLDAEGKGPALAIGAAPTRDLEAHEIGTFAQVECVADVVRESFQSAQIAHPQDVHFVQIKCPLLTSDRIAQATRPTATTDTLKSMGLSRGASALGVALALDSGNDQKDGLAGQSFSAEGPQIGLRHVAQAGSVLWAGNAVRWCCCRRLLDTSWGEAWHRVV
jgi:cyanuric acid amidohydrolase